MQNKNKSLLKNIGLFTIGSFGSKILAFLLVPLYTSVLSTAEYGSVDLITSTSCLLTPILLLSIFDATLRFGMDPEYQIEDVLSTSIHVSIKGTLILLIGTLFVSITHLFDISNIYLVFLCIYFVLGAMSQILNLYLRAKNQASIIAVSGILCTLITCLSNILLLLVFKWGIVGYMISSTGGVFVQIVYQVLVGKAYRDIRFIHYNNLSKPMIKYSIPLIPNSISWWVNNASDRYILTFIRGVSENGIYSVSYKIPTILSMFQGIFFNAWSISAIAEFDENDSDGFIGTNYTLYSFVSLLVCSGILIFNIPLARVLYKGDYFEAWKCVPFLLMGTVFSGIAQFEGSLFAATKKTKEVAKSTVIGAVVNAVCNVWFIYLIGMIGAALATFLGYMTMWILRTKYLQDFIRMKVNWVIHFCSIVIVSVQACFASVGVSPCIQMLLCLILMMLNRSLIRDVLHVFTKRFMK